MKRFYHSQAEDDDMINMTTAEYLDEIAQHKRNAMIAGILFGVSVTIVLAILVSITPPIIM